MKYIDKTTDTAQKAEKRLHDWRDNFQNPSGMTFQQICSRNDISSETVWSLLSDYTGPNYSLKELREALFADQQGICCYCGCEIEIQKTVVEHFLPKSGDKCTRTFTFKNLLLSCDGNNRPKKHYVQFGDTWESIAQKYEMTVEELKRKNAQKQKLSTKDSISVIPPPKHCDAAKEDQKKQVIDPTNLPDCWNMLTTNLMARLTKINPLL